MQNIRMLSAIFKKLFLKKFKDKNLKAEIDGFLNLVGTFLHTW